MKEFIRFKEAIPFMFIEEGEVQRIYYNKNCGRFIKKNNDIIDIDKRKHLDCIEFFKKK